MDHQTLGTLLQGHGQSFHGDGRLWPSTVECGCRACSGGLERDALQCDALQWDWTQRDALQRDTLQWAGDEWDAFPGAQPQRAALQWVSHPGNAYAGDASPGAL